MAKFPQLNFAVSLILIATGFVQAQTTEISPEIADAFHLNRGQLVQLNIGQQRSVDQSLEIAIDNEDYVLDLHTVSIRSEKFVLKEQIADGSLHDITPPAPKTVRGTLLGSKGSRVVGSLLDSGLGARIVMGNGTVYFIEPVQSEINRPELHGLHVLYRPADVRMVENVCGVVDRPLQSFELVRRNSQFQDRIAAGQKPDIAFGSNPEVYICEIALDADFEYFNHFGGTEASLDRMEQIINIVNDQYESQTSIVHMISGTIVRTAEPDPYTTSDASGLLGQFRNQWQAVHGNINRDVAHLFTGKDLNGNTIGIAWLGSICSGFGYGVAQRFGSLNCQTDLSAHELGHNWNASHCNCSNRTMNASLTCSNSFSDASINSIVNHRNSRGCLEIAGPPNDDFEDRITLGNVPTTIFASNELADTQVGEGELSDTGATAWWAIVAPSNGIMRIDLENSNFDTQLQIYEDVDGTIENLVPIAANDDETNTIQSDVSFPVIEGRNYAIRVGGYAENNAAATGTIIMAVTLAPHSAADFFWSDVASGAFNTSNSVAQFASGSSGSLYFYYDASMSDVDTGALLDIATSRPGVIEFTNAVSFDFDINVGGTPIDVRWGDAFGELGTVTNDYIDEMGAFTVVAGVGMLQANTGPVFFDAGYDFGAGAFLFGRVDFNVVGEPGDVINLITTKGEGMVVHNFLPLDPFFGSIRLQVTDTILLGDVNCDGFVNLLDIEPFIELLSSGTYSDKADFDGDGAVNLLDIQPFVDSLTGN